MPYLGLAPDLGAFESDYITLISISTIPDNFQLFQNYPNPFNPTTHIVYSLSKTENITLTIFNSLGEQVVKLVNNEKQSAGKHTVIWNARDESGGQVSTGIYFYRLELKSGLFKIRKMIFLK